MTDSDIIFHETIRMKIYQLLSGLFQLPGKALKHQVRELERQLDAIELDLSHHTVGMAAQIDHEDDPNSLLVDYSRLFIGPYRLLAPPYGSVYLDSKRNVMGDSTLDVQARYARLGIDAAEGFMDMPDHIAVELEFMYFLVYKEIDIIQSGQLEQAYDILFEQKSFANGHLNAWVPDFSLLVTDHSDTQFYPSLAHTAQMYIAWDTAYLNQIHTFEVEN